MKHVWFWIVVGLFSNMIAGAILGDAPSLINWIIAAPFVIVGLPGGLICILLTTCPWAMLLIGFPLAMYLWTHQGS